MSSFKEFSKNRHCPICNKPDYCCTSPANDGIGKIYLCKRAKRDSYEKKDVLSIVDGDFYVFVGESNQSYVYRPVADAKAAGYKTGNTAHKGATFVEPKTEYLYVSPELPHKELDRVYRKLISLLKLEDWHRQYLYSEGWTDDMISRYHIVSLPENDFLRYKKKEKAKTSREVSPRISYQKNRRTITQEIIDSIGSVKGVPGFYLKETNRESFYTINGRSGIVFPLFDELGYIYRLRIRLDYEDMAEDIYVDGNGRYYLAKEGNYEAKHYISMSGISYVDMYGERVKLKLAKYNNMTSFKAKEDSANGFIENYYKYGTMSNNHLGLYQDIDTQYGLAHIIEGEKKAIVSTYRMKVANIDIPGVESISKLNEPEGQAMLEYLREKGVKFIACMFDMDKYKNPAVARAEEKAVKIIKQNGFGALIGEWNEKQKGLDDALNAGEKIDYYPANKKYPNLTN